MSENERRDLEDSIKEFGTVVPIVLNIGTRNNVLIGGHQRVSIYADLGIEEIDAIAPPGILALGERYTGAAPNSLALSADGNTLYISQGGGVWNAVAGV